MKEPDEMEMPCQCRCGEWFELTEGNTSSKDNRTLICDKCFDEEQEYYDNMPESIQNGEKGELSDTAITNMDDVILELDNCMDNLNEAIS